MVPAGPSLESSPPGEHFHSSGEPGALASLIARLSHNGRDLGPAVHELGDSHGLLKLALEGQSTKVRWLQTFREALPLLLGSTLPHLVFTETALPDGNWADMLNLAVQAQKSVNVIAVARLQDVGLYLETIVRGVVDFIGPPLTVDELTHVV